jgi:hypothetical protein
MFSWDRSRLVSLAMIAFGAGIGISTLGIVQAAHLNPDNLVERCNAGTACIEGHSSGLGVWGVFGIASTSDGVRGVTNADTTSGAGVAGINNRVTGHSRGVYGYAGNGPGVVGVSVRNGAAGIVAANFKGQQGMGVLAEAAGPGGGVAIDARANANDTNIFEGSNNSNNAICVMDAKANLSCTGFIEGSAALRVTHRNGNGQRIVSYGSESATATIEDVGTARLIRGVANVQIDASFGAMMDRKWYYVFLTPLGDTRGLYVKVKTASGFQVREAEGGRSNLSFDYRIVAHPLDAPNDRLPLSAPPPRPRPVDPEE